MSIDREEAFRWACPQCRKPLESVSPSRLRCAEEYLYFNHIAGIWRFLMPERESYFSRFIREYETVRRAEGRGSANSDFYRALPYRDLSGKFRDHWHIRARSFQTLMDTVITKVEKEQGPVLKILDLGAGNCWFSNQFAERGHLVAAVDLLTNGEDGLGAFAHYQETFTVVQADFDYLPFAEHQFHLAIFNAAFHYSTDYQKTLKEVSRVMLEGGQVVVMDSPLYRDPLSGEQMVKERESGFQEKYGFPSNALPSENFLTYRRLEDLTRSTGLRWQLHQPSYGWRWALRPWKARLLRHREPARFLLMVGRKLGGK